jgi:hypothetical protein
MGLGSFFSGVEDKVRQTAGGIGRTAQKNPLLTSAMAYFANPLAMQNVSGSAVMGATLRGQDPALAALAAPGSLVAGGSSGEWADLAAFNAALVAGAAGGAAAGYVNPLAAALGGTTATQAVATGALAGGAAALGGYPLAYQATADYPVSDGGSSGAPPPDINEANDPATAAQFQRIRKAARMLGRAGTIKNKSAQTLGGGADGGQTLGTQLAVA